MSSAVATQQPTPVAVLENVLIQGNLATLTPQERTTYYLSVCESLGLNPLTRPFEYLTFQGKLILYARRDCTEQLRRRDNISITIVGRKLDGVVYTVSARAKTPDGREDESDGVVCVDGMKGEALANAFMKAETKAKRRVTLSICGMGLLDESEIGATSGADPDPTPARPVRQIAAAPVAAPTPDEVKARESLGKATTIPELAHIWASLSPALQKILEPTKDQVKTWLIEQSKIAATPEATPSDPDTYPLPTGDDPDADDTPLEPTPTAPAEAPAPVKTQPGADRATKPARISGDLVGKIVPLLGEVGVDWTQIRDDRDAGKGVASICGFAPRANLKIGELTPEWGQSLLTWATEMKIAKDARKRAKKQPEAAGVSGE